MHNRRIDPDGGGYRSRDGGSFHKAFGIFQIRSLQDLLPLIQHGLGASEMNIGRREEADGTVVMLIVVPAEESSRPSPGIHLTAEAVRIIRAIFQRFELCFRIRVIIADMRSAMGFDHAKIREKVCHNL